MQAVTMENDIRDGSDYGYYRQNLYRPENANAAPAVPEEASLEEAVYNGAGEDVVSDISSINNPLSNPEERTAFQERIAAQVNMETQAAGVMPDVELGIPAASESTYEGYQPELLGSGSGEEGYQPELLGSGESEVEIELLGSGSGEEGYQPELLGSGSGEEGYQPELLGSGESEVEVELLGSGSGEKGYQPELLGNRGKQQTYEPRILGSNKNNSNTETVHIKSHSHEQPAPVRKSPARPVRSGGAKIVRLDHADVSKIVKSHKKLRPGSSANRSSVERLEAQIESSIKESMKHNRESSREMNDIMSKKGDNAIERIVNSVKNSSKNNSKNGRNVDSEDYAPKHKDNDLSCQCPTCKNRRFVDRSNDVGVSFSSPQRMNSAGAAILARSHEGEHVAAEARKAFQEGRTIVRQSVTIYMRNCPDCGARYVAGGVTRTITKMRADVAYKKAMETVRNRHKNRDL